MSGVPVYSLAGTPRERGRAYGIAAGARIGAFLGDGLARLDAFRERPPDLADLAPTLEAYGAEIFRQTPKLYAEIEGLAEGAGISLPEAVLLQCRRELAGYSRFSTAGDCTTFADLRRRPVLAQTVDLAADMDDQIAVLLTRDAASGHSALILSFTGLLGYLGINDRGLAVGLNLVLGGDWRPGLPPYLAIRHMLDTAGSVKEALTLLSGYDLASSRCFMLCDRREAAEVEVLSGQLRIRRDPVLAHANHFLWPEFVPREEINVFARNGSLKRLSACQSWLDEQGSGASTEQILDFFAREPALVRGRGDRRREKTVAAVVLRPDTGEMHLRPGDPSRSATQRMAIPAPGAVSSGEISGVVA